MSRLRPWASAHRLDLVTLAALTVVAVLLWLPFGWNVSALTDEWVFFSQIEAGSSPFFSINSLRMFNETGLHLAHLLTPDSFVGLNLVFAALLTTRGFADRYPVK